jgi:hypothetical protein
MEKLMRCTAMMVVLSAAPLGAQGAVVPDNWTWKLDGAQKAPLTGEVASGDWAYQAMPPGWHLTTTTQGVTVMPKTPRAMRGDWGVETEFFLFPDPSDAGMGLMGIATTGQPTVAELRFLLRRDGQVALEAVRPEGDTLLVPWTSDTAADAHNGEETKRYVMRLVQQGGVIALSVNGREMLVLPFGENVHEPVMGFRAGPGLNLHISRFDLITPLAPPRKR